MRFFGPNLPKNSISDQKKKVNINIKFCIFELNWVPNLSLNCQFHFFEPKLTKNATFRWKQKKQTSPMNSAYSNKSEYQISLYTALNFETKFSQKGYFWSKTEKVHITIEFCISDLGLVPNSSLNWQFWFLDQICPKLVFQKITLLHVSMVITHYIKLICKVANRRNIISVFLLILVTETIRKWIFILQRIYLWHKSSKLPFHFNRWALVCS